MGARRLLPLALTMREIFLIGALKLDNRTPHRHHPIPLVTSHICIQGGKTD